MYNTVDIVALGIMLFEKNKGFISKHYADVSRRVSSVEQMRNYIKNTDNWQKEISSFKHQAEEDIASAKEIWILLNLSDRLNEFDNTLLTLLLEKEISSMSIWIGCYLSHFLKNTNKQNLILIIVNYLVQKVRNDYKWKSQYHLFMLIQQMIHI